MTIREIKKFIRGLPKDTVLDFDLKLIYSSIDGKYHLIIEPLKTNEKNIKNNLDKN